MLPGMNTVCSSGLETRISKTDNWARDESGAADLLGNFETPEVITGLFVWSKHENQHPDNDHPR
jgi:hypothetical protein